MAMLTQRLIVMMFMMSLTIGIVTDLYSGVSSDNILGRLGNETTFVEDEWDSTWSADTIQEAEDKGFFADAKDTLLDIKAVAGNVWDMSWGVLKLIGRGFIPWSFDTGYGDTQIEKLILGVILMFRTIATVLMIITIYLMWKNR